MSELKPANQHPDFGVICSHGSLKRKCYLCELEEELSLERQRTKELEEQTASTMKKLLDEKERSKVLVEALKIIALPCECYGECDCANGRIFEASEALKKYAEMGIELQRNI